VPPLVTIPLAILPQGRLPEAITILPAELPAATFERVNTAITEPPIPISAPPAKERTARLTIRQWLALCWIIGATVFVLVAVIKALRTVFWLWRDRKPLPQELQMTIERSFSNYGTLPKVWLIEGIGQPFVWGLLRGSIYLPANFVKVDNAEQRRGILGHELSHILRFDAAVNILQIIAQAVFWFHPFVWWTNKKIRAEREKCCDEMAIARLNTLPKDYSSAILNILIVEHESTRPVPSLAVAGPVKNIEERIKTMMKPGKKFYKRPSLVAATVVLLLALLTVPTALVLTTGAGTKAAAFTLHQAAVAGDIQRLRLLIAQGADVNTTDEDGDTPLHITARKGKAELTELLLAKNAEVDARNKWATTPLHYARSKEVVKLLLANGANVNAKNRWALTPLHCANNRMDVVELLLARGADINAKTDANETLVEWASWEGRPDVKEFLLAKGAQPTPRRENNWTVLHTAAKDGQTKLAQDLIAQGEDINAKNGRGETALHLAAAHGHQDMVRLLLDKGANVKARDRWNDTPLFAAARGGHKEVAELLITETADLNGALLAAAGGGHPNVADWLIAKGADVNAHAGGGWTPLHRAAFYGHKDFVELLIAKGADLNTRAKRWLYTPLHNAVSRGYVDTAQLLIAKGAKINVTDRLGWTPLHYACRDNRKDMAEFLIDKGADINAKDNKGQTALSLAKEQGHEEIVELLRKHGARN